MSTEGDGGEGSGGGVTGGDGDGGGVSGGGDTGSAGMYIVP